MCSASHYIGVVFLTLMTIHLFRRMGGGKQKNNFCLDRALKEAPSNFSLPARNMRKSDLGGVIFGCTHNTINECFTKHLFG